MAAGCVFSNFLLNLSSAFVFLRQELDQLRARIQTLEDRNQPAQSESSSVCATPPEDNEETEAGGAGLEVREERDTGGGGEQEEEGDRVEELGTDVEKKEREKAALIIQSHWREHRNKVCTTTC